MKNSSNKHLIAAIKSFKESSNIKQDAPIAFLDDDAQVAIFDGENKIRNLPLQSTTC